MGNWNFDGKKSVKLYRKINQKANDFIKNVMWYIISDFAKKAISDYLPIVMILLCMQLIVYCVEGKIHVLVE